MKSLLHVIVKLLIIGNTYTMHTYTHKRVQAHTYAHKYTCTDTNTHACPCTFCYTLRICLHEIFTRLFTFRDANSVNMLLEAKLLRL